MQNLIATALALIVGVFLLVTFTNYESNKTQKHNIDVAVAGAASQMAQFSRATQQYVNAHGATWNNTTHEKISSQTLISAGLLPVGWKDTNKFDQTVKAIGTAVGGTPTAMVYFDGQAKQVGGSAGNTGLVFNNEHVQAAIANRIAIAQLADYPQANIVPGVVMAKGHFNGHHYDGRTGTGPYQSWRISLDEFLTGRLPTDALALVGYPGMRTTITEPPHTCPPSDPDYPDCDGGGGTDDNKDAPPPPEVTINPYPTCNEPGWAHFAEPGYDNVEYEYYFVTAGQGISPTFGPTAQDQVPVDMATHMISGKGRGISVRARTGGSPWSGWTTGVIGAQVCNL